MLLLTYIFNVSFFPNVVIANHHNITAILDICDSVHGCHDLHRTRRRIYHHLCTRTLGPTFRPAQHPLVCLDEHMAWRVRTIHSMCPTPFSHVSRFNSAALIYFALMGYIVLAVLNEVKPMYFYILAAVLFVLSQLAWFLLSGVICRGTNAKIDGSFIATLLETAAVGVIYLAWRSITEGAQSL
jgi:hypothetical protein